ncbi:uncharacterized protein LOC144120273 [Amblyomma americanum]
MRFPLGKNNGARLRAWLQLVSCDDFEPTPYSRICEAHFEESQFETGRSDGQKLLKWNAVPTIPACDNRQKQAKRKVSRRPDSDQVHDTLATTEMLAASTTFPGNVHGCEVQLPTPEIEARPNETGVCEQAGSQ